MKIKKNDTVKVLSGRDRGERKGSFRRSRNKMVTVEGANEVFRHVKRSRGTCRVVAFRRACLFRSPVMLICPTCQRPTRVKMGVNAYGKKTRVCKKCGVAIN